MARTYKMKYTPKQLDELFNKFKADKTLQEAEKKNIEIKQELRVLQSILNSMKKEAK